MTSSQMIKLFQETLAVVAKDMGIIYSQVDSDTILNYLNEAQLKLFYEKYLNGGIDSALFSISQNIQELNKLIVTKDATLKGTSSVYNKSYILSIEDNAVFPIKVLASLTNSIIGNTTSRVPCNLVSYNKIDRYLTNNYNIPIILKPVYLFNYGGTEIDFSLSDTYLFTWGDLVISQIQESLANLSYDLFFTWDNSIITQENSINKYISILEFLWDSVELSQQNKEFNSSISFVWGDLLNVENIETSYQYLNFLWDNNIVQQSTELNKESISFIWDNIILYSNTKEYDENIIFSWNDLVLSSEQDSFNESILFVWDDIVLYSSLESSIIDMNFSWSNVVLSSSLELNNEPISFSWDNIVLSSAINEFSENTSFIWNNLIQTEILEDFITYLDFEWKGNILVQELEGYSINLYYEWGGLSTVEFSPTPILFALWENPVSIQMLVVDPVKNSTEIEIID